MLTDSRRLRKKAMVAVWMLFIGFLSLLSAQPTSISGTVNLYRKVTFVDCPANQVTVTPNASGYNPGDLVLLIQTEGATVEENNVGTFGSITNIGHTGNYEVLTIASVSGNVITFQFQIMRDYDPLNGAVQLVRIAHYSDAQITSAGLTAQNYDPVSQTGGILALFVDDTLYMGGNLNVFEDGFPGGEANYDNTNCGWTNTADYGSYYYPWTPSTANFNGAPKGYGIRARITNKEGGRGKLANAGGGGNQHNAGGGGGASFGAGGRGGIRAEAPSSFFGDYCKGYMYGFGGQDLSTYSTNFENRIFMGGGGGAGHVANASASPPNGRGGGGGPIVILRANVVVRNGSGARYINAYGRNAPTVGGDGAGGGGAGGTVLLDINTYGGTNVFHVRAYGGKGGNQNYGFSGAAASGCMGNGGGGGGGVIWHTGGSINTVGLATRSVAGGLPGNIQSSTAGAGCALIPNDTTNRKALAGEPGAEMTGLVIPQSNTAPNGCVLPVEFAAFAGKQQYDHVRLDWITAIEKNNRAFVIERAPSATEAFLEIGEVAGQGFSQSQTPYTFRDMNPLSGEAFYRLRQIDYNGGYSYSEVVRVNFVPDQKLIHKIYPNPVNRGRTITVEFYFDEAASAKILVVDQLGRTVVDREGYYQAGRNELELSTDELHGGIYFLQITHPAFRDMKRFIVQ